MRRIEKNNPFYMIPDDIKQEKNNDIANKYSETNTEELVRPDMLKEHVI